MAAKTSANCTYHAVQRGRGLGWNVEQGRWVPIGQETTWRGWGAAHKAFPAIAVANPGLTFWMQAVEDDEALERESGRAAIRKAESHLDFDLEPLE